MLRFAPFRIVCALLPTLLITSSPALADLGVAKNFAILSSGGHLVFGNDDLVYKIANPNAATCPAGTGCFVFSGGKSIVPGTNDKILTRLTTMVSGAGTATIAYGAFLASLTPTVTSGPIALKPGQNVTVTIKPGLNVIDTPSLVLGLGVPKAADPCANATGDPAALTIAGTAADSLVVNVGKATAAGAFFVCNHSRILLTGGITPDRVIVNVEGSGNAVALGRSAHVQATILAPAQGLVSEGGVSSRLPSVIDGGGLFGSDAMLGNDTIVRYWPLQEIGVPATIKMIGTVNTDTLPTPPQRTTTIESENNPPEPVLQHPFRPIMKPRMATVVTPSASGARSGLRSHLTQLKNFSGISQNGKTPSDVQFAAGTSRLIEMVNVTGAFYNNPSGTLINTFDLGQFFGGSVGQGTDPRVYYDAATGNFFAAYEMKPAGGDDIRLAIASNPGNSWSIYDVASNNTGATFDQPKLGIGSDKITISWNNYGSQSGTTYIVIQKAAVVARAASVPVWIWSDDTTKFQVVPANSYSNDKGIQYGGWRCCGSGNFDLLAFTGVPGISPVNYTDTAYGIGAETGPPPGRQPSGGDPTINTDDDRLLSTIWENGHLWGNFNEGCTPQNDRLKRACERYVEIGTPGVGVQQNWQLQWPGNDIYYSALTLDQPNVDGVSDLFFGVTYSSRTVDPTAMVLGVPGSSFTPSTPAIIELGGPLAFAACAPPPPPDPYYPCPRWGDYSAAARDPNHPANVWIVNQYGGLSGSHYWGTSITELHI